MNSNPPEDKVKDIAFVKKHYPFALKNIFLNSNQ
jgi:hypothetical protein